MSIFISYEIAHHKQAEQVKKHLESNLAPCEMQSAYVPKDLQNKLENSRAFVLILSEEAQHSDEVCSQLTQARNLEIPIFSYEPSSCPPSPEFDKYLAGVKRYNAYDAPINALNQMTQDIQSLLADPPPHETPGIAYDKEFPNSGTITANKTTCQKQKGNQSEPLRKQPTSMVKRHRPQSKKHTPQGGQPSSMVSRPRPQSKKHTPQGGQSKSLNKRHVAFLLVCLSFIIILVMLKLGGTMRICGQRVDRNADSVSFKDVTLSTLDINKFSELNNLRYIELEHCRIEAGNLNPLLNAELRSLEVTNYDLGNYNEFFLHNIFDLDFSLSPKLENLDISGIPFVTSLENLKACANNLKSLDISDTGIRDFEWLRDFTKLEKFRANRTEFNDTSFLEEMIYLEELCLSENGITSLEGLVNTTKLSVVDLSHNSLTDVSVLKQSASCLKVLHLEHNALTDLSCLSGANNLTEVYVDGNALTSLNWLVTTSNLRMLSASNIQISGSLDITFGEKLQYLNISNNQLQAAVIGIASVEGSAHPVLDLSNNQLSSLKVSQDCFYSVLALVGNDKLDCSSLTGLEGYRLFLDFPPDIELQFLKDLSFGKMYLVNCPLNRRVEVEENLFNEYLMTRDEALEEIANIICERFS